MAGERDSDYLAGVPVMTSGDIPLLLAIDDDPDQLALVRVAALRAGGLRVMTAESAQEAMIQLQARESMRLPPPDLVLTDLKMPGIDGLELMRALRTRPGLHGLPVLFLTSSNYNRDRIMAHLAGADGFFQKPVRFGDLVAIMKVLPSYVMQGSAAEAGAPAEASVALGPPAPLPPHG